MSCFIYLKRDRSPYSSIILPVTQVWKLELISVTTKENHRPENLLESITENFPAHHRVHRCQIAGCQTCVSQGLLFLQGHSPKIFNRELESDFPLKSIQSFNALRMCVCLECSIATLFLEPGVSLGGQNLLVSIAQWPQPSPGSLTKVGPEALFGQPHMVSVIGWSQSQLLTRAQATTVLYRPSG